MKNIRNTNNYNQKYEKVSQSDESEIIIFQSTKKISVSFRAFYFFDDV